MLLDDIGVADLLAVLYRRRWTITAVAVVFVALAALYSLSAAPVFEARVRLEIEPDSPRVVTFRPVVDEEQRDLEYYQTQYEVLRSRALARRTLDALTLWDEPKLMAPTGLVDKWTAAVMARWARLFAPAGERSADAQQSAVDPQVAARRAQETRISALLGRLNINPVKQSRLVDIAFRSTDPVLSARVANGIAAAYIDHNLELRREGSQEASKWLTERLGELREQVDTRQGALQDYREQKDAVSLEDQQNIIVQKLAQLNVAVTAARTQRIAKQALYDEMRTLQASGAQLDTLPPIVSNPFIQKLKADLAGLQRERAQLSQQLGPLHPDLIKVDAAIATADARLNAEIGKIIEGIRNDVTSAEADERGLRTALEEQKREVLDLNRKSIGYGALKRDAASTQQLFEGVLQRLKEADLSGELQTNNARILDAAEVPRGAVWPKPALNLLVALFGGLFVGVGLALGGEFLHPRITTAADVAHTFDVPLLAITPHVRKRAQVESADAAALPPAFRESVRGLRTRILLSPTGADVHTLAVTSTSAGEGKTLVARNLAISVALAGRRVLLIDADLRRPRIHHVFNLSRSPGLAEVIAGEATAADALHEPGIRGLSVLTAGSESVDAPDLLELDQFKSLLTECAHNFDLIVIDSPPVMAVADAAVIANATEGVLFVVGADTTRRDAAQIAIERLVAAQGNVIGIVLNKADVDGHASDYYPYYHRGAADYYLSGAPAARSRRNSPKDLH